ncbi:MAG: short-chain fatty acid transporter [Bacteroidia bacterium]|nr:short-chain fatty acid transporter [Bacteroidia bacterium]
MSFTQKYALWFRKLFPSPFSIAIVLTLITLIASIVFSEKSLENLVLDWQEGLWNSNLLAFAFQMMLMLVLGHALALSDFFNRVIAILIKPIRSTAQAAALVTASTIIVAFFNWGLGLIFGALLARKIGEQFSQNKIPINYPLIGAAGYVGLMVWHGGLSGSALTKVAEPNHIRDISNNSLLPEAIYYTDTVFSSMNMMAFILLLVLVPTIFYFIGKKSKSTYLKIKSVKIKSKQYSKRVGAEKIDYWTPISKLIGLALVVTSIYIAIDFAGATLGFITPNYINFCLLGLGILLHKNFHSFLKAIDKAIVGSSGILIQFPLYFGILALMQSSGLINSVSNAFTSISTQQTLPIFTFFSAGFVNVFVPSGGGQWAIQGPIILEAATNLNVPLNKIILSMAYGDQLTNMLQPFWALPLLSITGLKARDILPYTLILLAVGLIIFLSCLMIF